MNTKDISRCSTESERGEKKRNINNTNEKEKKRVYLLSHFILPTKTLSFLTSCNSAPLNNLFTWRTSP